MVNGIVQNRWFPPLQIGSRRLANILRWHGEYWLHTGINEKAKD